LSTIPRGAVFAAVLLAGCVSSVTRGRSADVPAERYVQAREIRVECRAEAGTPRRAFVIGRDGAVRYLVPPAKGPWVRSVGGETATHWFAELEAMKFFALGRDETQAELLQREPGCAFTVAGPAEHTVAPDDSAAPLRELHGQVMQQVYVEPAEASRVAAVAYREATAIDVGCGGGIAGIVHSATVHRDGTVEYEDRPSWRGKSRPRRVGARTATRWFARLERINFFETESRQAPPMPDALGCDVALVGPRYWYRVELDDATRPGAVRMTR
jgi:hypothetical protein